ncbi:hypothetical protein [Streptococcus anginosus]|uniref:hypothetical protein n=1 Tax=Streptococcus anginosus TaxID=1328 RepID=UPI0003549B74|nr:hypothetical protein [Streptococcus anginosus]MDP1385151.1 hypothetical protein [Streptococcus anginosus]BAN62260.1 hypothetical protein ANG_1790 [Streptococcus anginosus subsp. whileyi MAS624]
MKPVTKAHHFISKAPNNNNIGRKTIIRTKSVLSFIPIIIANNEKIKEYDNKRKNKSIKFLLISIPTEVKHLKITTVNKR